MRPLLDFCLCNEILDTIVFVFLCSPSEFVLCGELESAEENFWEYREVSRKSLLRIRVVPMSKMWVQEKKTATTPPNSKRASKERIFECEKNQNRILFCSKKVSHNSVSPNPICELNTSTFFISGA